MNRLTDFPLAVFGISFFALWLSTRIGVLLKRSWRNLRPDARDDFGIIIGATLTLLGLLIGFTFSMAVTRYDLRKNYEEAEANAIGTEYVRATLLPAADAANVRTILRDYLDQRILFYTTRDGEKVQGINQRTDELQNDLWSAVRAPSSELPTPMLALAVSGMNDVLNSQGYTQAAWRNRVPVTAWVLMAAIAVWANIMLGYGLRHAETEPVLLLILPLVLSISFFLIADVDTPRGGVIKVFPQNLVSLVQTMRSH